MFPDFNSLVSKYKHRAKKILKYVFVSLGLLLLLNIVIMTLTIYNYLEIQKLKEDIIQLQQ
jgi:hypothetical protein